MDNEVMEEFTNASDISSAEIAEEFCGEGEGRELELEAENLRLKGELICARSGIPGEIAGDIIAAAMAGRSGGVSEGELEEAVKAVYERISSAVGRSAASRRLSTGVRSEKGHGLSDEALRRAFGLR